MPVVGAAAPAEHIEVGQLAPQGRVARAEVVRIALVELLRLVQLGVALGRRVGAQAADPLAPLRDVRFSAVGVGINFALALGSVVAFGYWRRIERARAARRGER